MRLLQDLSTPGMRRYSASAHSVDVKGKKNKNKNKRFK